MLSVMKLDFVLIQFSEQETLQSNARNVFKQMFNEMNSLKWKIHFPFYERNKFFDSHDRMTVFRQFFNETIFNTDTSSRLNKYLCVQLTIFCR